MKKCVKKEIEELIESCNLNCSVEEFKNEDHSWHTISVYWNLSENFIREFQDKVDWNDIFKWQKLSEDFIREFQDKVSWKKISCYQELSKDFLLEFKDKVDWDFIEIFTKEDIEEYEEKLEQKELEKTRVKNKFKLIRFKL